jgi:Flp pilus assembly pilin Flp
MLKRLLIESEGQTLLEYGLLASLIALVCIAVLSLLGERIRNIFVTVNNSIRTV